MSADEVGHTMAERSVGRTNRSERRPHPLHSVRRGNWQVFAATVSRESISGAADESVVLQNLVLRQKLLRILPPATPLRLEGETDIVPPTGAERSVDNDIGELLEHGDGEVGEIVIGNPRVETASAVEIDTMNGAEELLGDANGSAMAVDRQVGDDDGSPPARRQRIGLLRVAAIGRMLQPTTRTDESIVKSRLANIAHLLESKAVKDWSIDDAMATGAKMLTGRFVDDHDRERSRYCTREFARAKDTSVFANASDVEPSTFVDSAAVKRDYPTVCFDGCCVLSSRGAGANLP